MISVIVPVKNEEANLRKLFSSFNNQTFKDFEIIVVDDYSSDNTLAVANDNASLVLSLVNGEDTPPVTSRCEGMARCAYSMNLASDYAKGDILVFCNADMQFKDNEQLGRIVAWFADRNYDVASTYIEQESGNTHSFLRETSRRSYLHPFTTQFILIRKNVFNSVNRFPIVCYMDVGLDRACREHGFTPHLIREPVIHSRLYSQLLTNGRYKG